MQIVGLPAAGSLIQKFLLGRRFDSFKCTIQLKRQGDRAMATGKGSPPTRVNSGHCASIDRSKNTRRRAKRDLPLPVATGPSVVAGRMAVARKADTRRSRHSCIASCAHRRRSSCSARGSTTAPSNTPSLRLRLRLECACARGPKRPLQAVERKCIFAVRIPLIKPPKPRPIVGWSLGTRFLRRSAARRPIKKSPTPAPQPIT